MFLVVLLALVGATPAHAYNAPGPRWPGDTIRYADTLPKNWNWSIEAAVRTWNRSGADIRFRKVPRSRAQVVIGYGNLGSAAGLATIGRHSGASVRVNSLLYRPLRERDRVFAAQVLAHELGHVLGLQHSTDPASALYAEATETRQLVNEIKAGGKQEDQRVLHEHRRVPVLHCRSPVRPGFVS